MADSDSQSDSGRHASPQGAHEVLPQVYEELRRLAASKLARESGHQTLQATALVHEAWLKVSSEDHNRWERTQFYVAAATAMRRILIDRVRHKRRAKRGGGLEHAQLLESQIAINVPDEELLAIDEALESLAREDGLGADLVQLRYFVGFNMQESADALGISVRSAHRVWSFARAWLRRELQKEL